MNNVLSMVMKHTLWPVLMITTGLTSCISSGISGKPGKIILTVDDTVRYQYIKGFGQSNCWWATNWSIDDRFTQEMMDRCIELMYDREKGIGLNYYRHNVGGGPTPGGVARPNRQTYTPEVSPGVYDLNRDAHAMKLLDRAIALGAEHVTIFMNSPPVRMTISGDTFGNPTGQSNLKPECYDEYAKYAADITKVFVDAGYPVKYVSPINEPQHAWNERRQEGTHFEADQVLDIGKRVIREVQALNLPVKVSLPETANWHTWAYSTDFYEKMYADTEIRGAVDHFSGHSYHTTTAQKKEIADFLKNYGKRPFALHQTEYGQMGQSGYHVLLMPNALEMARVIHDDLSILNCELWEYWVGVREIGDSYPGGLVYARANGSAFPSKNLWVLGNYSRFISGSTRIKLTVKGSNGKVFASAYRSEDGKKIIIIATNPTETEQPLVFDKLKGKAAKVYETTPEKDLEYSGDVTVEYTMPPDSVVTFVFE